MAKDDKYALPQFKKPDGTQLALHPKEQHRAERAFRISLFALGFSALSAVFSAWQAWEQHQARIDAQSASAPVLAVLQSKLLTPVAIGATPSVETQIQNAGKVSAHQASFVARIDMQPGFQFVDEMPAKQV